jgi:hypothetical protein
MPPLDDFSVKTLNEIISAGVSSKLIYEGSVCDSYPCYNEVSKIILNPLFLLIQGACAETNNSIHGYTCFCNQFFTGNHCEIKVSFAIGLCIIIKF